MTQGHIQMRKKLFHGEYD